MSVPSVTLFDRETNSRADILVGLGFNCYRFTVQIDGQPVDVLWAEDGFSDGTRRPSSSGIPLLFPFPGRIQGTEFSWEGKTYLLEEGDGRGNAIHGFVHTRPWRIMSQSDTHVTGQFHAAQDDPSLLERWPCDFCIDATYRLSGGQLLSSFEITNPGDVPLPCGFGTHPYFRIPLTTAGTSSQCRLVVPVAERWVLHDMNATGQRAALDDALAWQQGIELGDTQLDDVLTRLVPDGDRFVARVEDPASRLAMQMEFSSPFRECVVYTPGHREAVCIEPYTCVPDPFRLQRAGIEGGLQQVEPGQTLKATVTLQILPAD